MSEEMEGRTRYYRWVLGLFGGYLIGGVVLAVILLLSITDANAGYPALFFGSIFVATAAPACVVCAVLAGVSLMRREPYRPATIAVLVVSCLVAWNFLGPAFRLFEGLVRTLLP
jgi:hypothetical protein